MSGAWRKTTDNNHSPKGSAKSCAAQGPVCESAGCSGLNLLIYSLLGSILLFLIRPAQWLHIAPRRSTPLYSPASPDLYGRGLPCAGGSAGVGTGLEPRARQAAKMLPFACGVRLCHTQGTESRPSHTSVPREQSPDRARRCFSARVRLSTLSCFHRLPSDAPPHNPVPASSPREKPLWQGSLRVKRGEDERNFWQGRLPAREQGFPHFCRRAQR